MVPFICDVDVGIDYCDMGSSPVVCRDIHVRIVYLSDKALPQPLIRRCGGHDFPSRDLWTNMADRAERIRGVAKHTNRDVMKVHVCKNST